MIPNPHDSLFKQVFERPEYAAAYLARVLPASVRALLDLDAVEVLPGGFIDEELRHRYTDLLLYVPRRGAPAAPGGRGGLAIEAAAASDDPDEGDPPGAASPDLDAGLLIYIVLEHQSSVDPWMAWRLLRYIDRIWDRWRRDHPEQRLLPLVIPLVFYHGERPWTAPRELQGLMAWGRDPVEAETMRRGLGRLLPNLGYLLTDLHALDAEPGGADKVALVLAVMKWARHRDFIAHLEGLAREVEALARSASGLRVLAELGQYILIVRDLTDFKRFVALVARVAGSSKGDAMMTLAQQLGDKRFQQGLEEGRQEGRREGRQEGRQEGRREGRREGRQEGRRDGELQMLSRMLKLRFRVLDARASALLASGSAEELAAWGERLLSASSLPEVFGAAWDDPTR